MKRTTAAILAGIVLAGAAGAGVAAAATGDGPGSRIADILSGLVKSGTINQEQADAVAKAIEEERAQARTEREEHMAERRAEVEALLQDTLGMSLDEVRSQLQSGKTLREIAGDKADELAAGAKANAEKHLAEEVSEGRITQEQADDMLAALDERIQAWLDGTETGMGRGLGLGLLGLGGGPGGHGPGGHRHGGMRGPGWSTDDDSTSGTTQSSSAASTSWTT